MRTTYLQHPAEQQRLVLAVPSGEGGRPGVHMLMPAFVFAVADDGYTCTTLQGDRRVLLDLKNRPEPHCFKFDAVLPESTTQQEVFERE